MKGMLKELGIEQESVIVNCDNQSVIHLSKHQVFHERSKHIDVWMHFIQDVISNGVIKVMKISTDHNLADMLNKSLHVTKFNYCMNLIRCCKAWKAPLLANEEQPK